MGRKEAWAAKATQRRVWADKAEAEAAALEANHNRDWAFVSQPGHISARARQIAQTDRAMALRQKAAVHRSKAAELDRLASTHLGDAEAARSAKRDGMNVATGDLVDSVYGIREVVKVNAKTLRLAVYGGGFVSIDKARCRVVRRAEVAS